MKRGRSIVLLVLVLGTCGLVGWYVPFRYDHTGYCSESPLYRYQFGIYACEYNAEAHPDFQCWMKLGGFWSYVGLVKLECETDRADKAFKEERVQRSDQDTLALVRAALEADLESAELMDRVAGDINGDGVDDLVVVLEVDGSRTVCLLETTSADPLAFNVVGRSSTLIECADCGGAGVGDPYRGIAIRNSEITFKQLFGACCKDERTETFAFDTELNDWFLLKRKTLSSCCAQNDTTEVEVVVTTETRDDLGLVRFSEQGAR